jgi:hypothetical protein
VGVPEPETEMEGVTEAVLLADDVSLTVGEAVAEALGEADVQLLVPLMISHCHGELVGVILKEGEGLSLPVLEGVTEGVWEELGDGNGEAAAFVV